MRPIPGPDCRRRLCRADASRPQATKILFQNGTSVPHVATGVEFGKADSSGSRQVAYARKEVIVAGGAINVCLIPLEIGQAWKLTSRCSQTPALLQLSGIGDSAVLGALGIKTIVDLKTVGKNFQEQTMNSLGARGNGFNKGGRGPTDAIAYPNIYQLFGSGASASVQKIKSSVNTWAQSQAQNALSASALQTIFNIQANLIINNNGWC